MGTTITNVRVFDGLDLTAATAVRLELGTIVDLGDPYIARADDDLIDGRGGTLVPGLIDSHVHLLPGAPAQSLSFGVTTILDMFSKPPLVQHAISEGHERGNATVFSSSIGATAPGGHPSMMYAPFPYVSNAQEAVDFVRARRNEGATYLKLFYESGQGVGMTLPSLELPTIRALVDAAHAEKMLAVAHVHQAVDAVEVVDCGVDVLAHVPTDEMTRAQITAIAEAQVAVIATLSIQDGFPSPGEPAPLLTQAALVDALSPAWIDVLEAQSKRWMPPQMPSFEIAAQNVGALYRAGCTILAGTDAPNPGTVHGASLHRELQHLVAAGLSPVAALRAATADPAEVFELVGRGRIISGAIADLVLVDGIPDEVISDSQKVVGVWKRGERQDLTSYDGSATERAGISFHHGQTQRVIDAVIAMYPQFAQELRGQSFTRTNQPAKDTH
ncbi:MAG: amidohydrolase family protein [Rhodococcus sp. (in: high G+C Gram-positive bacteria)]|uniref:amidohydrolase family protein n=1 Tax=Rhodococcus sp. TaxID=1831 RepID=UPI002ADB59AE|nr:amidohydrolase family protein [Rhodococcus sp. (in: high G+C Gram-positive bacteria)]